MERNCERNLFDCLPSDASKRFWEELNLLPEVIETARQKQFRDALYAFRSWVLSLLRDVYDEKSQKEAMASRIYARASRLERRRNAILRRYLVAKERYQAFREKATKPSWGKDLWREKFKALQREYKLTGEVLNRLSRRVRRLWRTVNVLEREAEKLPSQLAALYKKMGVRVYRDPRKGWQVDIVDWKRALPFIRTFMDEGEVSHINRALQYFYELESF